MSGAHIVENTNNEKIEKPNISNPTASTPPPNNEELLNNKKLFQTIKELSNRLKKLESFKLEDFEPLKKISQLRSPFFSFGNTFKATQPVHYTPLYPHQT
ncbi:hypothetical protein KH0155_01290 [Helicobacter pylori]